MESAMFLRNTFEQKTIDYYKKEISDIKEIYDNLITHLKKLIRLIRDDISISDLNNLPETIYKVKNVRSHKGPGQYFKTTSNLHEDLWIYKICKDLYCYIHYFTKSSCYKNKFLNAIEMGMIFFINIIESTFFCFILLFCLVNLIDRNFLASLIIKKSLLPKPNRVRNY